MGPLLDTVLGISVGVSTHSSSNEASIEGPENGDPSLRHPCQICRRREKFSATGPAARLTFPFTFFRNLISSFYSAAPTGNTIYL